MFAVKFPKRLKTPCTFVMFIYMVLPLTVLWNLLLPGYILTLDMIFSPNIKVDGLLFGLDIPVYGGLLPFLLTLKSLSFVVPVWAIQKLILFFTLFLAGLSAHHLCPARNVTGKFFAGFLFMLNPFVYVRFMAGHWQLLLAYAITPLAVKFVINFFQRQRLIEAVKVSLLLTLIAMFNSHMLLLNLLLFSIFFIAIVVKNRGRKLVKLSGLTSALFALFFLLNIYWILPTFLFVDETILTSISYRDLLVFTAKVWGTGPNIFFSVASMHGFWRAGYHYISYILPVWYLPYIVILFLAIYGFLANFNDKRLGVYIKGFAAVGVISLILGVGAGISTHFLKEFFEWLFESVVFLRGFRDTHKFVALLALAYAYLGGLGVSTFYGKIKNKSKAHPASLVLIGMALLSPFVYSLNMFGGFNGELSVVDYPAGWYEVNAYLNEQSGDFRVLFLPWHAYMTFSWSGGRLSNPAHAFFDREVIQGENIEVPGIETQSRKPIQQYIHFLLRNRDKISNFGELVAPLNVKYILLAKEVDYRKYDFLYRQEDLELVLDNQDITVFLNKYETSKFYLVNEVRWISGWEELLRRSKYENLMEAAYFIGKPENLLHMEKLTGKKFVTPEYIEKSPAEYMVKIPMQGILVFASPYKKYWKADGLSPQPNMGLTNTYANLKVTDITVYNEKFAILSLFYLISIKTLACIFIFFIIERMRKPGGRNSIVGKNNKIKDMRMRNIREK